MLTRYYPSDISLHSFDNASALAAKRDNWQQIQRFFVKQGITPGGAPLNDVTIEEIINAKVSATVQFINGLYEFLSGRKAPPPPKVQKPTFVPAYARPTAARTIANKLGEPAMAKVGDAATQGRMMRAALAEHEAKLQDERVDEPDRYDVSAPRAFKPSGSKLAGKGPSMGTGTVHSAAGKASLLAPSKAAVRGQPTATLTVTSQDTADGAGSPSGMASVPQGSALNAAAGRTRGAGTAAQSVLSQLNDAARAALTGSVALGELAQTRPAAVALVEAATAGAASEPMCQAAVQFMEEVQQRAARIGQACLTAPGAVPELLTVMLPLLSATRAGGRLFSHTVAAMSAVGSAAMAASPAVAQHLCVTGILPSLASMLTCRPGSRHGALQVLYAWTPRDISARIGTIRALQESLASMSVFLGALSVLVFLEPDMDDTLLDLYLYYATLAIAEPAPSLRAAGVSTLAVLTDVAPHAVAPLLQRLYGLTYDTWWETKAQLAVLAASMLCQPRTDDAAPDVGSISLADAATAGKIAAAVLRGPQCTSVARVAVAYLAPALQGNPALGQPWLRALLALPRAARAELLALHATPGVLPLNSVSGGQYRLPPLRPAWDVSVVAAALLAVVHNDQLQHLDEAHVDVLLALVGAPLARETQVDPRPATAQLDSDVLSAVQGLQDHVFVGLCDSSSVNASITILSHVLSRCSSEYGVELLKASTLAGSLLLLHRPPTGNPPDVRAQQAVAEWLQGLVNAVPYFAEAVKSMLAAFLQRYPGVLTLSSPVSAVAQKLGLAV